MSGTFACIIKRGSAGIGAYRWNANPSCACEGIYYTGRGIEALRKIDRRRGYGKKDNKLIQARI